MALPFCLCACGLLAKDTDKGAAAADAPAGAAAEWQGEPVPYKVEFRVIGDAQDLAGKMEDLSQLRELQKEPPDSLLGLERRARADQETAVKLMQSECYYDGEASFHINETAKPALVTVILTPGPRFVVGQAAVVYDPRPDVPRQFLNRTRVTGFWGLEKEALPDPSFPDAIPGVTIGEPIVAKAMLEAVAQIPMQLQKRGYPLARITKTLYTLDKPAKKLNAEVVIDPGLPATMGPLNIKGAGNVHESYLRRLVPWQPGEEPWDDALMQDYANSLRATGLFRQVEVRPDISQVAAAKEAKNARDGRGEPGKLAVLPVAVDLTAGPQHTVSASARWDSDTGFGVEGTWEHRNLFGNGEKLALDAPISQEETGIKAHFEKPAFIDRQQRLLADMHALRETTDAYQQSSLKGELGINRRLARQWSGGLSLLAEGGSLKDNEHDEQAYAVFSPRAGIRYDGRNNPLNPSKGTLLELRLKPFGGYYEEEFSAFASTLSGAAWYAPLGRKNDGAIDDTVVLAGRVELGAMPGATSLRSIPASLRYYTGGAGSVRGYTYQSIGPQDSEGDPLGGRSYQVVNLEARFMVAENIGLVPFLDGGMVYKEEFPHIFGDMDWGTGLGLRYYTPIGPVRLDVATPLHRIDDDPPVQVYISIGQSF
ncbi:MAG: outer membrane protein assembly factor [Desulfovibrio sp.]|nr:outer membrane protein assembly factor [Desulfovibrio sp.]